MDQETLYTASKWHILKHLENQSKSPLEISKLSNISLANVSQQLRLLEMAGLVKSERVPNRDKGQPRLLYSLAGNHCYVISTANKFVEKKRLTFNTSHQIVLKIWFLENPEIRLYAEKAFWKIEEHLQDIQALYIDLDSNSPISFYLVPKNERINIPEIQELRHHSDTRQMTVTQITKDQAKEISLHKLYEEVEE